MRRRTRCLGLRCRNSPDKRRHDFARHGGFTYLAVLFLVALTAAGLAALGQAWHTASRRERERELEFRGTAIANAIVSYQHARSTAELPRTLEDLLNDRRGPTLRHHLRQPYADPFTGEADWELMTPPATPPAPGQPPGQGMDKGSTGHGGFIAVRSRSAQPLLRERTPQGTAVQVASDWVFGLGSR